jgi:hypothetical protein
MIMANSGLPFVPWSVEDREKLAYTEALITVRGVRYALTCH